MSQQELSCFYHLKGKTGQKCMIINKHQTRHYLFSDNTLCDELIFDSFLFPTVLGRSITRSGVHSEEQCNHRPVHHSIRKENFIKKAENTGCLSFYSSCRPSVQKSCKQYCLWVILNNNTSNIMAYGIWCIPTCISSGHT